MTLKLLSAAAAVSAFLTFGVGDAHAGCSGDGEQMVGSVCTVAFNYCPRGYLPMTGGQVDIMQYQMLYALIGTTYGGDGRVTFGLPDMRGRTPVGSGVGTGLTPVRLGMQRGQESVTQSVEEMAPHSHGVGANGQPVDLYELEIQQTTPGRSKSVTVLGVEPSDNRVQIKQAGAGQPQYNVPPQLALNYCIAYTGNWPQRP